MLVGAELFMASMGSGSLPAMQRITEINRCGCGLGLGSSEYETPDGESDPPRVRLAG